MLETIFYFLARVGQLGQTTPLTFQFAILLVIRLTYSKPLSTVHSLYWNLGQPAENGWVSQNIKTQLPKCSDMKQNIWLQGLAQSCYWNCIFGLLYILFDNDIAFNLIIFFFFLLLTWTHSYQLYNFAVWSLSYNDLMDIVIF